MNKLETILSITHSQMTITIYYYLLYLIYNMIDREMQIQHHELESTHRHCNNHLVVLHFNSRPAIIYLNNKADIAIGQTKTAQPMLTAFQTASRSV